MKPGTLKPIVIACDEAEADVSDGAVGNAEKIWNALVTLDAAAYCESPDCAATTSHAPTSRSVTTPNAETVHALLVVPTPSV